MNGRQINERLRREAFNRALDREADVLRMVAIRKRAARA